MLQATNYKLQADRGATLYLAMITMSGALAIAFFTASVFIKESRISQDIINSLKAVYVADTVMEYSLYQARHPLTPENLNAASCHTNLAFLSSAATCSVVSNTVDKDTTVPRCSAMSYSAVNFSTCTQIISSGAYGGVNRKIEIVYPNL